MAKVKVRIAVAVDKNGKWAASGFKDMEAGDAFDWILDDLEDGEARYFVEAELEIPERETKTVQGEVKS